MRGELKTLGTLRPYTVTKKNAWETTGGLDQAKRTARDPEKEFCKTRRDRASLLGAW
jgi:hypothetical protein